MLEGYPGHLLYIRFPPYGIAYAILILDLRASMSLLRRRFIQFQPPILIQFVDKGKEDKFLGAAL